MFQYDLSLRKAHKYDLKQLFELKNEAQHYHHRIAILNETDQADWFESLDKDVYQPNNLILIGVDPDCSDEFVSGDVGAFFITNINYINGTADIGCDIYRKHRGKGFGHKLMSSGLNFCKEILGLRKICCEVLDFNVASQKMCEKAGFVREGLKVKQVRRGDQLVDSIIYGLFLR